VLAAVKELCTPGAKIVDICEKGDKLIEEEVAKVYRGNKKITKGSYTFFLSWFSFLFIFLSFCPLSLGLGSWVLGAGN